MLSVPSNREANQNSKDFIISSNKKFRVMVRFMVIIRFRGQFRVRVRITVRVKVRVGVRVRVPVRVRVVIKPIPLSRYPLARKGI